VPSAEHGARRAAAALALCAAAALPRAGAAQVPVLLQGIADFEFWSTNAQSMLL